MYAGPFGSARVPAASRTIAKRQVHLWGTYLASALTLPAGLTPSGGHYKTQHRNLFADICFCCARRFVTNFPSHKSKSTQRVAKITREGTSFPIRGSVTR